MRRFNRRLAIVFLAVACSHTPEAETSDSGSSQLITEAEIEQSGAATAYDAILKLRGNFLSNRGKTTLIGTSSALPTVYLDGISYGDLATLKNISARQVATIRLYRSWEATTKFGTGNMGGVIEVITKIQ